MTVISLAKQTDVFDSLKVAGFPFGNAKTQSVTLPVTITVSASGYHADKPVSYTATAGKSGSAK